MESKLRARRDQKASFCLGNFDHVYETTYDLEYSDGSYTKADYNSFASKRFPKTQRIVRNPCIKTPPASPRLMKRVLDDRSNTQKRDVAVCFGYDEQENGTAYHDQTKQYMYQVPRPQITPKRDELVFPENGYKRKTSPCSQKNSEYVRFGDDTRWQIVEGNAAVYDAIVKERSIDSIAKLTKDNRPRLTTQQQSYWHSMPWLRGANKKMLVKDIPNHGRLDHIYSSVYNGVTQPLTRESRRYGWSKSGLRGGIDRFYRPDRTCYQYPCPCKRKLYCD